MQPDLASHANPPTICPKLPVFYKMPDAAGARSSLWVPSGLVPETLEAAPQRRKLSFWVAELGWALVKHILFGRDVRFNDRLTRQKQTGAAYLFVDPSGWLSWRVVQSTPQESIDEWSNDVGCIPHDVGKEQDATRNKGIATRSKDATSSSSRYY